MPFLSVIEKVEKKWNIQSHRDFVLINLAFALAGMGIVYERKPVFELLGISPETPFWVKTVLYIVCVFPLYQLNLIIAGTLLGQFSFFWEKQKRLGQFFLKLFSVRADKA